MLAFLDQSAEIRVINKSFHLEKILFIGGFTNAFKYIVCRA
jgi:hypothetical protein